MLDLVLVHNNVITYHSNYDSHLLLSPDLLSHLLSNSDL